jgi:DNA repair protein SbcD/Mre11
MRILHTADWHAGKVLWNRSRVPEQEKVFAEIVNIARREKVHVVVIAGDVFETYAPSPEAERLVYSALAELVGAGIPAIVVGGNHDHPKRLAAVREMLAPLNVFVRAEPQRAAAGGVIEIKANRELARIAVLPWVPHHRIVEICQLMEPEDEWYKTYSDDVAAMCQRLAQSFSTETVNILVAHLFAFGAQTSGSERPIHVAQPFAIPPARFPSSAQYVALGHLHRQQEIICPTRCFYSGSPLQLDFGERDQQKGVVIVDVKAGKPAHVETVALDCGRRLRELTGSLVELKNLAGEVGDDFLKLIVTTETRLPGIADQLREIFPNALDIKVLCPHEEDCLPELTGSKQPHEHFADFFRKSKGSEPPEETMEAFRLLQQEAQDAAD